MFAIRAVLATAIPTLCGDSCEKYPISRSGVSLAPWRAALLAIPQVAKPLGGADVRGDDSRYIWTWRAESAGSGVLTVGTWMARARCQRHAQNDPNPGALTFTGGFDFPTLYFFRGIRQETDAGLTMWPFGDLGIALSSGDGGLKSVERELRRLEQPAHRSGLARRSQRKAALRRGFLRDARARLRRRHVTRHDVYGVHESEQHVQHRQGAQFQGLEGHMLAPYGVLAFELAAGQADGRNSSEGTYLELGVGPSWPLGDDVPTLAIPVKFGFSLSDYYERPLARTHRFRLLRHRRARHHPAKVDVQQVRVLEHPRRRRLPHVRRYDEGA